MAHVVAEHFAHAADLPVETLSQNNPEVVLTHAADFARLGFGVKNAYPTGHAVQEGSSYRLVDGDEILFLVIVFRAQNFVDDVAVVGQQDQPGGFFIEPPDGKDALFMADEVDDVVADVALGGAGNAHRFIEADVDFIFLLAGADDAIVNAHFVSFSHLCAELGAFSVNGHTTAGDPGVGFAARAHASFT